MEVRATFAAAGGKDFHVIPCLNEHPRWIAALADLVRARIWPAGLPRGPTPRRAN